jgi:hypothetical protein
MGMPVALDVLENQVRPELLGGFRDLVVGEVGSVLEDVVAGPRVNLAEVVVRPLGECELLLRLHPPHLHQNFADLLESRLGEDVLHSLQLLQRGRLGESDAFVPETSLLDSSELPFDEIHRRTGHHLALVGVSAVGVGEVVVVIAGREPPPLTSALSRPG